MCIPASRGGARCRRDVRPHAIESRRGRGRYSCAGEDEPVPDQPTPMLAARLHRALLARGETVAAAESLTAGLFCATLATVPGRQRDPARRRRRLRDRAEDGPGRRARRPAGRARSGQPGDRRSRWPTGVRDRCRCHLGDRPDRRRRSRPGRRARSRAGLPRRSPTAARTDVVELDLPGDRARGARRAPWPRRSPRCWPARLSAGTRSRERPSGRGVTPSADARRSVGPAAPDAAYRERTAPACGAAASPLAGQETAMTLLRTQLGNTLRGHRLQSAPNAARRLRCRPGQPRLPLGGGARAEGSLLRAARLHLRRPRRGAGRPAGRGQPRAARVPAVAPCARSRPGRRRRRDAGPPSSSPPRSPPSPSPRWRWSGRPPARSARRRGEAVSLAA